MSGRATRLTMRDPFVVYRNTNVGLIMKYPASWQKSELSELSGFTLGLFSPLESPQNQFRESVVLSIQTLLAPIKLGDFRQFNLQAFEGPYEFGTPTSAKLAGLPACQVTFTGPLNPVSPGGRFLALFAVTETRGYVFCYAASASRFDSFMAIVQEMIESVDIV